MRVYPVCHVDSQSMLHRRRWPWAVGCWCRIIHCRLGFIRSTNFMVWSCRLLWLMCSTRSRCLLVVALEQLSTNHAREEIKRTAASVVWMLRYYSSSRISSPTASASASGLSPNFSSSTLMCWISGFSIKNRWVVWHSSNGVCHRNEVKPHWAQLLLRSVTTFGGSTISLFIQATQPGRPSVGRWNVKTLWRFINQFTNMKKWGNK